MIFFFFLGAHRPFCSFVLPLTSSKFPNKFIFEEMELARMRISHFRSWRTEKKFGFKKICFGNFAWPKSSATIEGEANFLFEFLEVLLEQNLTLFKRDSGQIDIVK